MRSIYRFNIVRNVTIDRISVSAEIAPKNIRLADKIYIFGCNSAEPQKFRWRRSAWHKISAWRRCRGHDPCILSTGMLVMCCSMLFVVYSMCCECGTLIEPNPADMCVVCLRNQVDITEGIPRQVVLYFCRNCERYSTSLCNSSVYYWLAWCSVGFCYC